jgi:large subunit ribosomal protein L24
MKPDTERKKYYEEKLHRRKKRMHVHLSKALRGKLKSKRRAIGLRSGDQVRIMRGPRKGKEGKVIRVSTVRRKVYLEGMTVRNARAKEVAIPMEPSNLLLIGLEPTPERKKIFTEDAFRKKEPPKKKEEKKPEAKKEEKKEEKKPEAKKEEKVEKKPEAPAVKPPVPKPGAAVSAQPTKR